MDYVFQDGEFGRISEMISRPQSQSPKDKDQLFHWDRAKFWTLRGAKVVERAFAEDALLNLETTETQTSPR